MTAKLKNWAGNYEYQAARVHYPTTLREVQEVVARSEKVKVLGTRHSFNDIADTSGDLLCLKHFDKILAIEAAPLHPSVTVEAGITYGKLCRHLHDRGFALHNLASLPHISVAGACATATHGSGDGNGNLATAVSAMEVVTADGEVRAFSRDQDGESFRGMVVGLGGLGVVTKLTLDLLPMFHVEQGVYENLALSEVAAHFEQIVSAAYSVSLFTNWHRASFNQVWLKRRVENGVPRDSGWNPTASGMTPAPRDLHPISSMAAENCTPQMGLRGPWHERLPHFRMDFTPSSGEELQSEYLVPRQHAAAAALQAIAQMREGIAPLLLISEIRTIAADDLWMSPCYKQASVAIHFTWKRDWPAVKALLPEIERQLAPFTARPHWGKLFTMPRALLQPLYEKLPAFRQLLLAHDPGGKFRNAFLDHHIFGTQ